jgi:hypothetical protein
MAELQNPQLDDLEWLVQSRSSNQNLALTLYKILKDYSPQLRNDFELTNASQGLVAAVFSLWRAVFLVHDISDNVRVLDHAEEFLAAVIQDNAIGYQQDRRSSNWTCFYYINNARYRIESISAKFPKIVRKELLSLEPSSIKDRWDFWYNISAESIINFEKILKSKKIS